MSTSALASLRFPVSLGFGGLFMTALFWVLWSFTNVAFIGDPIRAQKIEFTRIDREETLEKRRQDKPVLERPERTTIQPPRITSDDFGDEFGSTVFEPTIPAVPTAGGIPMGSDGEVRPVFRAAAVYPPAAAARGQEGWVQVQYDVSASGAVVNAMVVGSEPGTVFDSAALTAVSRWRFTPRVVEGIAVERIGMQTILRFNLEGEE